MNLTVGAVYDRTFFEQSGTSHGLKEKRAVIDRTYSVLLLLLFLLLPSCGYRLAGTKVNAGAGRTIAIPTFANSTTTYRVEQRISDAVRREFVRGTKYRVTSENAGDVLVSGQVVDYVTNPILFNERGRASSYNISVGLKILVTDMHSGEVLYQNDHWVVSDVFELGQNSSEFVPEDPAAVDRLSRQFASSLVATVLHRKP
jgi:hypothetical protein